MLHQKLVSKGFGGAKHSSDMHKIPGHCPVDRILPPRTPATAKNIVNEMVVPNLFFKYDHNSFKTLSPQLSICISVSLFVPFQSFSFLYFCFSYCPGVT